MKTLLIKELKSIFCSSTGAFFSVIFLTIMGLMLWFFSGSFNIPQSGQASLSPFFRLTSSLFAILIPVLTMRLFAEEKRMKTLDILRARPIGFETIYFSKFLACAIFLFVTLLPTLIYIYSISRLANPAGNIDLQSIVVSYISLYLISLVFITIGLFASSLTDNLIIALLLSIILCLFSLFGFDLLADFFFNGKVQVIISSIGLSRHYNLMQRGVIQVNDLVVIFNYIAIFILLTLLLNKQKIAAFYKYALSLFVLNLICLFLPNINFDFTADKRYTLNDYTKELLEEVKSQGKAIQVNVYLEGDLNVGFQHLQNEVTNILEDFNRYAGGEFNVKYCNPYLPKGQEEGAEFMKRRDMPGIHLNETDREGKVSQKTIYPYAQIVKGDDTLTVSLLKNIHGYTADENLNASIESLEFEFIDAIRLLNQQQSKHIAFIQGHGELERHYVYDAEELLSKYYYIVRGQLGNDISDLNSFDAIIIAGPTSRYSESDKYIIDQYIMNGGKALWLVDGAYYSSDDLMSEGYSASMKNDTNMDDLLFSYGVRINPNIIQDVQCASIYLMTGEDNSRATIMPCYYMPLLIPSTDSPITKNTRDVKTAFASSIDILNLNKQIEGKVLLSSSASSHVVKVPEPIDFDVQKIQNTSNYFEESFLPIAVSLDGVFNSAFTNRLTPENIISSDQKLNLSKPTRMIVVASSSVIRNELRGQGNETQVLPMGFDIVSQQQFGNRDFIVNAVNWLTDDDGWMQLRTKHKQMRILNKKEVYESQNKYAIINIGFPILFILLIMGGTYLYRKKKYEKIME